MFGFSVPPIVHTFSCMVNSQQKVVLRVPTMTDDKIKQKAIEAVADIYGNNLRLGVVFCFLVMEFFCPSLEVMF
jgi:hypothetical protein